MNTTPNVPGSDEREELVRLLPQPAERDLPGDRHRQLQELLLNHIAHAPAERPRRSPRRRLAYLTSALAAAAAVAVAVGVGGLGDAGTPAGSEAGGSTASAPRSMSGQQILLAAATTAAKAPAVKGAYWYVKLESTGAGDLFTIETWTARDSHTWMRSFGGKLPPTSASPGTSPGEGGVKVIETPAPNPFRLGGAAVTLEQLEALPTDPEALRARIDTLIKNGDVRTSAGELTGEQRERAVFQGLVSLVSQLPAPPAVRAAAFRAFAAYPDVESRGEVDGGQDVRISFFSGEPAAQLVIDPATAQVRRADVVVLADGGIMGAAEGGTFTLTTEWTDTMPL